MATPSRRYICFFCGSEIATAGHDPCELILVTRITSPDIDQDETSIHCHAGCLADASAPNTVVKIPGFPRRRDRGASSSA